MNDARHTRRAATYHAATLTLLDQTRHEARTLNLSQGGVSLRTESQIRLAQTCAVTLEVELDGVRQSLLAMGQVIYSDPDPGPALGYTTGVQFLKLDPDSLAVLKRLLA